MSTVRHEVRTHNVTFQILQYDEMSCKSLVTKIEFKCSCFYWFSLLDICYLNLKIGTVVDFEDIGWG